MNQVVMITGASRGIGRATALAFAAQGFDVVITARALEEGVAHAHAVRDSKGQPLPGSLLGVAQEIRALGRQAWAIPLDLLAIECIEEVAARALDQAGRIDVLINNAMYQGSDLNAPLAELGVETLQRVANGYLIAPMLLSRAVLKHMGERGSGVVINVTSGAGESNPPVPADRGGWGYAYGAGKAAVSRLSGIIRAEMGARGIRAYTLNPGVVTTEALHATIGEQGIAALGAGAAPPEVPAAVMHWLACRDTEGVWQKRTVHAQPFALEHRISIGA